MKRRRQVPPDLSQQEPVTGSPSEGEPVFLVIGRLRRSHGIQGEMLMDVLTDFPERLRTGRRIYVGESHEPIKIASIRGHGQEMIIRLAGVDSPEATSRFRNQFLFVKASELPQLPEGQYYHHQLLGLTVVDEAGQSLGTLTEILETGANDVYVVKSSEGKEQLLPAVEAFILGVDLERKEIRVRPPEWQ